MPERPTVEKLLRRPTLVLLIGVAIDTNALLPTLHAYAVGGKLTIWTGNDWMGLN